MLKRVIIRSSLTDEECENLINDTIAENPNDVISFKMLVENTVSLISRGQLTTYTLIIQIEKET